jgi:hypothetical protein
VGYAAAAVYFRDDQSGWDLVSLAMAALLLIAPIAMTVYMAHGGQDPAGPDPRDPRGGDMLQFMAGASVLNSGASPEALYDRATFRRHLEAMPHPGRVVGARPNYPPPIYQAFALLGSLDQALAGKLLLWSLLIAYAWGCALLVRAAGRDFDTGVEAWLLLWASPAAQLGIATGQPAGLWLLLLAGGLYCWRAGRALSAGMILGILCIKPTLAAPVALALLLAGQWRALAGFALGGAALLFLSLAASGAPLWVAYLGMLADNPDLTEQVFSRLERHFSLRGLLAMPVSGTSLAVPIGITAVGLALALAFWMRSRVRPFLAEDPRSFAAMALLLGAASFASPHVLDYDLVLYFPLMLWAATLLAERRARRFGLGVTLLLAFYLAPISYPLSKFLHLSLGSFATLLLLVWCCHACPASERTR